MNANPATKDSPATPRNSVKIDDGKDIGWDISSGSKGYNTMIEALRQRATGALVLREGMLQTNPDSNEILTVNVTADGVQGAASMRSTHWTAIRPNTMAPTTPRP